MKDGAIAEAALSTRRRRLCIAVAVLFSDGSHGLAVATAEHPDRKWFEAAEVMRQRALGWGDQPYGAVLVMGGVIIGEGPSRVVKNSDPDAHAEREAIRDAQRRFGTNRLEGAVLYSTSRPCPLCEAAAARANVARMYVGAGLIDAGVPRE